MTARLVSISVLLGLVLAAGGCARSHDARHPVVLELFTAQGCSSCPPANAHLAALADRPDVLALSFNVTYWDRLGWKDTFAAPAFTARQWDYARAWGRGSVYTPQAVVDGRLDAPGMRAGQMEDLIRRARPAAGPEIDLRGGEAAIGAAPDARPAQVWLVRYDPGTEQVPVAAGENGGRTVSQRDTVRELALLGAWTGAPVRLRLPAPSRAGLTTAVLVQAGPGGPILAAARQPE